jgi:hypothetical protein
MQAEEARAVLDRFRVADRLEHIRRFVWREGSLRLQSDGRSVYYELEAHWPTAVLEPSPSPPDAGLERRSTPVVEGRWVRGVTGYVLRVGIDLAVPSAIFVRARGLSSFVPYAGRATDEVEQALHHDLTAYVNSFLSTSRPVPEARQLASRTLPAS